MIKTKIVATLGPACAGPECLEKLIAGGVDVFRLNFSHGKLEDHARLLENLNQVRARYPQATAVLGDLGGPKIRTSNIEPEGGLLAEGQEVEIVAGDDVGAPTRFGTTYPRFVEDVQSNHRILIDDGNLVLQALRKEPGRIVARVIIGGPMHSRKGINLPDTTVSVPSVTAKDWACIDWAIEHGLNYLALSFVRQAAELREVKEYLRSKNSDIQLIAKIEKPQAIEHLEGIIEASDAILVARGDLGVEMDLAEVPLIQKRITHLCRQLGKPVIVATQMLQSMIERPAPTRAEVSDVANAILDLTDAVMLSGETAVGKYPELAVAWLERVARVTEKWQDEHHADRGRRRVDKEMLLTESISRSVAQIVDDTRARLVVAWSETGATARLLSKSRIDVPVVALSSNPRVCERLNLEYGIIPVCQPGVPGEVQRFAEAAERLVREKGWASPGDQIVLVAGHTLGAAGTTNTIMVHTIL